MGSELYVVVAACAMYTLKKQVGCFNHRVVTLHGCNPGGLHKVSFGI